MTAKQSTKAYAIAGLIGLVIAGISLLILFALVSEGEEAVLPGLLIYLALGTVVSFVAGAAAVVFTGRETWMIKGVLACPVIYLLCVIWIGTAIASDDVGSNDPARWNFMIPLLVSILFSVLGAAAGIPIMRYREKLPAQVRSED